MRKYLAVAAVVVLAAFAAPAFAAVNPFIDVPINHWSYDAIGQLAARGILSGYPDGTYKGRQPTTRYEMASALARALALVDMSKASKQDVELLKKLVVEFKDELDSIGVRIDSIDERFGKMDRRLGGWRISGVIRQDLAQMSNRTTDRPFAEPNSESRGFGSLWRARLFLDRWWGENEGMHFFARIEGSDVRYGSEISSLTSATGSGARTLEFTRFFVEIPFWNDTKLTVGRILNDSFEAPYYLGGRTPFSKHMDFITDSWMFDRMLDVVRLDTGWGMGNITLQATHTDLGLFGASSGTPGIGAWDLWLAGQFQFTDRFGIDLGLEAFLGDKNNTTNRIIFPGAIFPNTVQANTAIKFNRMWVGMAGLRLDFTPSIALRGMYFLQNKSVDYWNTTNGARISTNNTIYDNANAYKAVLDVKQSVLRFTSLWLEYNHLDRGFWVPSGGASSVFNSYDFAHRNGANFGFRYTGTSAPLFNNNVLNYDLDLMRAAAEQQWTDKWSTWLFYTRAKARNSFVPDNVNTYYRSGRINHMGVGINYQYNPSVLFGLAYTWAKFSGNPTWNAYTNPSEIRFRTQVSF